jgi:hypothetical protein
VTNRTDAASFLRGYLGREPTKYEILEQEANCIDMGMRGALHQRLGREPTDEELGRELRRWSRGKVALAAAGSVAFPVLVWLILRSPGCPAPDAAERSPEARLTVKTPRGMSGNLRSGASLSAKLVTSIPNGTKVTSIASRKSEDGATWRYVRAPDGKSGWMHGDILA